MRMTFRALEELSEGPRKKGRRSHPQDPHKSWFNNAQLESFWFTKHQPVYTNDENDWFRLQLATTMDVDCPWWMDWFHGGEHAPGSKLLTSPPR